MNNVKIGVIGRQQEVLPYMAAGAVVAIASKSDEAVKRFRELKDTCILIFVSDDFIVSVDSEAEASGDRKNVISSFPGAKGISHNSVSLIKDAVSRAIGFRLGEKESE